MLKIVGIENIGFEKHNRSWRREHRYQRKQVLEVPENIATRENSIGTREYRYWRTYREHNNKKSKC